MAQFKIGKTVLQGFDVLKPGIIQIQFAGFKPKKSKDGNSINFNPILKVIDEDRKREDGSEPQVFFNMNSNFGPGLLDPVHAFGLELPKDAEGDATLPGKFDGPDDDPTKWVYSGPLMGAVGKCEIIVSKGLNEGDKDRNEILQFFCAVEGCTERHSTNLCKK